MSMSRARLGSIGEHLAARYLQRSGWRVVARNWRHSRDGLRGEIDIVAWDGSTLVFCEVKARRGSGAGGPLAAVTPRKLAQLRRLAGAWLAAERVGADAIRFDVLGVTWPDGGGPAVIAHVRGITQ